VSEYEDAFQVDITVQYATTAVLQCRINSGVTLTVDGCEMLRVDKIRYLGVYIMSALVISLFFENSKQITL